MCSFSARFLNVSIFLKLSFCAFGHVSGRLLDIREDGHRMKTPPIDRYISLNALRSRVATARPIEIDFRRDTGVQFSDQRKRNRLGKDYLGARMSAFPLILTQLHHSARIAYALDHVG